MPSLGGWEIVAILAVLVLLFGAKKLPDAARGIGRSLRIFKSEIKDPSDVEGRDEVTDGTPGAAPQAIAPPAVAPVQPVLPAQPVQANPQPVQPEHQTSNDR